ncbi:hypothetical protein FHT43_006030 [Mycolicibacterium sp. BK607]|nr:hypothetical protein [Mycolicibacterium sp. BK607]
MIAGAAIGPWGTGRRGWCAAASVTLIATSLAGCSVTTAGQHATAPAGSTSAAAAVNPAQLNTGGYPTAALPPMASANSEQIGRLVEGRRMAAAVAGPWQADATLIAAGPEPATVVQNDKDMGRVSWPQITALGTHGLPFVVGFVSDRHTPAPNDQTSLRNAVLRFADPNAATAAAQGMVTASLHMPRIPSATPIVTEPERAVPIPGHPEAAATELTYLDGAARVQELVAITSRGPFVLLQSARAVEGPDRAAQLVSGTLDRQLPLIDAFTPTDPGQFAALPLDPTGLVARTLPSPPDRATSTTGAAYPRDGALHFEDNPVQAGPLLADAGVDYVSINLDTLYQARDAAAAQQLTKAYGDLVAATPSAQATAPVAGLPNSRCIRASQLGGVISRYWCVAAVDRFMIKTVARQLDQAQQQLAAQYRILAG